MRVEDLSEIYTFNKYRLHVLEGPDKGKDLIAERRVITIGSAHDGDLVLDDATVSRRHCRIVFDGGSYILEDFGSKNGTRHCPKTAHFTYCQRSSQQGPKSEKVLSSSKQCGQANSGHCYSKRCGYIQVLVGGGDCGQCRAAMHS